MTARIFDLSRKDRLRGDVPDRVRDEVNALHYLRVLGIQPLWALQLTAKSYHAPMEAELAKCEIDRRERLEAES